MVHKIIIDFVYCFQRVYDDTTKWMYTWSIYHLQYSCILSLFKNDITKRSSREKWFACLTHKHHSAWTREAVAGSQRIMKECCLPACSSCFLVPSGTTFPGITKMPWALPHQKSIRKYLTDLPTGFWWNHFLNSESLFPYLPRLYQPNQQNQKKNVTRTLFLSYFELIF